MSENLGAPFWGAAGIWIGGMILAIEVNAMWGGTQESAVLLGSLAAFLAAGFAGSLIAAREDEQ